jgi:hypothetical protein
MHLSGTFWRGWRFSKTRRLFLNSGSNHFLNMKKTGTDAMKTYHRLHRSLIHPVLTSAFAVLLSSCASFGPYHANTPEHPYNSIRGSKDGRYKLAFIEFGDQGSNLDNSQIKAALDMIHQVERPVLFVYIHGWQIVLTRATSAGSNTSSIRYRVSPTPLAEWQT